MEDVVNETLAQVNESATNGTKIPATPEGAAVAYASLLIMALIPIVIGSFRSIHSEGGSNSEVSFTGLVLTWSPYVAVRPWCAVVPTMEPYGERYNAFSNSRYILGYQSAVDIRLCFHENLKQFVDNVFQRNSCWL